MTGVTSPADPADPADRPDLPYVPLQTPLVAVEPLDLATITDLISAEDDPARRHDDWHPDFPREDDLDAVGMVTDLTGWSPRQVRRLDDGLVVGTIGFFGPPEPAGDGALESEVGYGLVEPARGQGLMGQALAAVLTLTDALGVRVRAGTTRANAASLATLRAAGFVVVDEPAGAEPDPEREVRLVRPVRPVGG